MKEHENGVTYLMKHKQTDEVKAHHSQLSPFHMPPDYILNHPYYQQALSRKHGSTSLGGDELAAAGDSAESVVESESLSDSESSIGGFSFEGFHLRDDFPAMALDESAVASSTTVTELWFPPIDKLCVPLWDERRLLHLAALSDHPVMGESMEVGPEIPHFPAMLQSSLDKQTVLDF